MIPDSSVSPPTLHTEAEDVTDQPNLVLVNPKQYQRIMRRRQVRGQMETGGRLPIARQKYLHESRREHALKRKRMEDGRFDMSEIEEEDAPSTSSQPPIPLLETRKSLGYSAIGPAVSSQPSKQDQQQARPQESQPPMSQNSKQSIHRSINQSIPPQQPFKPPMPSISLLPKRSIYPPAIPIRGELPKSSKPSAPVPMRQQPTMPMRQQSHQTRHVANHQRNRTFQSLRPSCEVPAQRSFYGYRGELAVPRRQFSPEQPSGLRLPNKAPDSL